MTSLSATEENRHKEDRARGEIPKALFISYYFKSNVDTTVIAI